MKCLKCGMENPESRKSCNFCSYAFVEAVDEKEKLKPKTFLIHTLGFALIFTAMLILSSLSTIGTFLAVGFLLAYTWTSVKSIKKSMARPVAKGIGVVVSIAQNLWLVFVLLWSVDAAFIPDDYTIADLRSAPSEYNVTYELLCSLTEGDGIDWPREKWGMPMGQMTGIPGFPIEDFRTEEEISEEEDTLAKEIKMLTGKNILGYAERLAIVKARGEDISRIWKSSETYRYIIHDLNKYDQIADLTEPSLDSGTPFLGILRALADIHLLYAPLACERGDNHTATESLLELDSVVRKLALNTRTLVGKLACSAILRMDIRICNYVINHPTTSRETVTLLADHFAPLSDELTCLRNPLISEYLMLKNVINKDLYQYLGSLRWIQNLPFFKRNSTLRVYRNYWNSQPELAEQSKEASEKKHEELSAWPDFYPDLGPVMMDIEGEFPWHYEQYNRIGVLLLKILMPAYARSRELQTMVHVQDDLLQIVINTRLGRKIDLTARSYTDNYIIDLERKLIYSPGLDQTPFTKDDIRLLINPAVIGF